MYFLFLLYNMYFFILHKIKIDCGVMGQFYKQIARDD
jgi:hypothetical protein